MAFIPRPSQKEILKYQGGTLGISAVPGSGKTHSLSALAAKLVEKLVEKESAFEYGKPETEILIVTFTNAAVANFASRIGSFLEENGLISGIGYRVQTLHSMAGNIVRNRSESFGLDPDFLILDGEESQKLMQKAVTKWLAEDEDRLLNIYLKEEINDSRARKIREENWPKDLLSLATNVISQAKDYQLSADEILSRIHASHSCSKSFHLLQAAAEIYQEYSKLLNNYPALDYADLMNIANRMIATDAEYLALLQKQWPVILEDEAQDSSLIQEAVLRKLTRLHGNWVRVGDPNQAIFETFTTADPKFLINFLLEADHTVNLQDSGRSTVSILRLANNLIKWVSEEHPTEECRTSLVTPYILPTPKNDPQSNPEDAPERIVFIPDELTSSEEVALVSKAAAEQVKLHPLETTAILVPNNDFGAKFFSELTHYQVDVIEILKSNQSVNTTAEKIAMVFEWLSLPTNIRKTKKLFEALYHPQAERDFFLTEHDKKSGLEILSEFPGTEDFLYPLDRSAFSAAFSSENIPEMTALSLFTFRYLLQKWLEYRGLRIDHLILIIAQDIFSENDAMNIANHLARIANQYAGENPGVTFSAIAQLIRQAAHDANKYPGLNQTDSQFDPKLYAGKIVVTTFHKAKGLEWDQVYLTSCNNYEFPVGPGYQEKGYSEFARGTLNYIANGLNLEAEALEQLRVLTEPDGKLIYQEGAGTKKARIAYISERMRLLFVGITRARKGLQISWNNGTRNNCKEAVAVKILRERYGRRS